MTHNSQLDRIETLLSTKKHSFWLTSIIVPLIVASIPAIVLLVVSYRKLESESKVISLKRLEVLSLVINNFSSEKPERTLVSLDLIKELGDLDDTLTDKIRLYAINLTDQKLQEAFQESGKEGAVKVEDGIFVANGQKTTLRKIHSPDDNFSFQPLSYNSSTIAATLSLSGCK